MNKIKTLPVEYSVWLEVTQRKLKGGFKTINDFLKDFLFIDRKEEKNNGKKNKYKSYRR